MICVCGHEHESHYDGLECQATDIVAPGSFVECPCIHYEADDGSDDETGASDD